MDPSSWGFAAVKCDGVRRAREPSGSLLFILIDQRFAFTPVWNQYIKADIWLWVHADREAGPREAESNERAEKMSYSGMRRRQYVPLSYEEARRRDDVQPTHELWRSDAAAIV
jgi:hypothetical protein